MEKRRNVMEEKTRNVTEEKGEMLRQEFLYPDEAYATGEFLPKTS